MYPIRRMWNKYYRTVVTWPRHFYSHLFFFSASISSQICFSLHQHWQFTLDKPFISPTQTDHNGKHHIQIVLPSCKYHLFMYTGLVRLHARSAARSWQFSDVWLISNIEPFFFYLSSSSLVLPTDWVLSDSVPSPVRCNLASTTWSLSATFLTTSDSVNLLAGARLSRVSTSTWATFPPTTRLFSVFCLFTVSSQTFCCCLSLFLLLVVCTVLAASRAMTSTWALRPLRARSYTPVCWLWLFHLGSLRHQSLQFCG